MSKVQEMLNRLGHTPIGVSEEAAWNLVDAYLDNRKLGAGDLDARRGAVNSFGVLQSPRTNMRLANALDEILAANL